MTQGLFTKGRFVWHDLMTRDVKKARAFYSELMGWKVNEMDMGPGGKYQMLMNGTEGLGGLVPLDAAPAEVPSHWIAYISVEDVDKACKLATESGGKVCVPAFDIPGVGRTAVVEDPSGATFSPFKAKDGEMRAEKERPDVGEFCWYEVLTSKVDETKAFYAKLFGWSWEKAPMPGMDYFFAKSGDKQRCGLMAKPEGVPMSSWLCYLNVKDLEESTKRALSLGAKVLMPSAAAPGIGTWQVVSDPTGAAVALFQGA